MPFVGRTTELAALDQTLDTVEQGTPRAVELEGPAGIGKSRLLAELAARADARGHVVLTGSAAELEQDLPFWVFAAPLLRGPPLVWSGGWSDATIGTVSSPS